jgi:ADP-ribosylation factor-like protein 13B
VRDIKLYDLGGGSRVRDIWKHYLAESYAFIYVIDASNRQRVNECRDVFASFVGNEKVAGKPILILANKQDQNNALDESEIVQYLDVEDLVNKFQIPCRIEMCSAFSGSMSSSQMDPALKLGFEWLISAASTHFDEMKTRVEYDVEQQRNEESRTRREKQARIKKRDPYSDANDNDNDLPNDRNQNPWKTSLNVNRHFML